MQCEILSNAGTWRSDKKSKEVKKLVSLQCTMTHK